VLNTSSILDWNITLFDGSNSLTFLGPASGNNSQVQVEGSSLVGSAANLAFDFSGSDPVDYLLLQYPTLGVGANWFCIENAGCSKSIDSFDLRLLGDVEVALRSAGRSSRRPAPLKPPNPRRSCSWAAASLRLWQGRVVASSLRS
jgi:hypothetical protein